MEENILERGIMQCEARIELEREKIKILEEIKNIPHCKWMPLYFDYVDLRIPYSLPVLNENAAFLAGLGWIEKSRIQLSSGYLVVEYRNPAHAVRIEITLDTSLSGSLCKRVKIDEKIEPVYEIVCLEA